MNWLQILDLAGIFVFALSGCVVAVRSDMDVVGVVVLGLVTALAGGVMRDILIADLPPAAVREPGYLVMPLVAAALVIMSPALTNRLWSPVLVLDAAGLGLFAAVSAGRAIDAGLGTIGVVLTGTVAAVGGGLVRDILANQVPQIFATGSRLYAIPAAIGAGIVAAAHAAGAPDGAAQTTAVAVTVLIRLLALRFDWSAPLPRR
ncbi:MAG: TRIC cation channel family protein [Ilumatobacteraceae bacterium]|nr:TRIC cation channel family protein [Ilumatobacteraceae bacterium]